MELLSKEQRLSVLLNAKKFYKDGNCIGMCECIGRALYREVGDYNQIYRYIDGFNYKTAVEMFGARPDHEDSFWWSVYDTEKRLKYFDYLIELNK